MRPIFLGPLLSGQPQEIQMLFTEIEKASHEADLTDIAQPYSVTGTFTETRTLNVTTPTLANIAAVLATLIADLQRGGTTRST